MVDKKIKWLIYTVLVGLIPIAARLLICQVIEQGNIESFKTTDFVAFGLILHISIINEIEHWNSSDKSWKTVQNGVSISFIAFYSILFAVSLLGDAQPGLLDNDTIKISAMVLSVVSFLLSFSVFDRISKLSKGF
ncbi:MAG: hypothetical protein HOD92_24065 [Deltaproteobacteria bacterium]|jgi:hypothetical protein|nr:hypothetical protein [Deltaproteobacteria bacterium]